MATKAERFRYQEERSGAKREHVSKKKKEPAVDTSLPGVSATDKKAGGGAAGGRNESKRAGKKSAFALEHSDTKHASRKSTRGSSNRSKPDSNLQRRETRKNSSPEARALRAKASRK